MTAIDNFIESIFESHLDNAQNLYLVKKTGHNLPRVVSPLTNFVFEYFLFNSLYSVDWPASMSKREIVDHPRDKVVDSAVSGSGAEQDNDAGFSEAKQQRAFLKFCRGKLNTLDANGISNAFLPLAGLGDLSDTWTDITPDKRISAWKGEQFFRKIKELGELAKEGEIVANKATFKSIETCCNFVYLVRNNIFHGAKSLGEIYEPKQAKRFAVYDLFVRCLNSLFFLAVGKKTHGSAICPLPIVHGDGSSAIDLTLQDVFQAIADNQLKPEDSFLHWKLFRSDNPSSSCNVGIKRALFYPSAGKDILFPIIVGLPYCTDFYFYEINPRVAPNLTKVSRILKKSIRKVDLGKSNCDSYEFEFASITRRIWVVRKDNTDFFEVDVPLAFYFHRGDSQGEGGADQLWDSELLERLVAKSHPETGLHILTDGKPGGLNKDTQSKLTQVGFQCGKQVKHYFSGVLFPLSNIS